MALTPTYRENLRKFLRGATKLYDVKLDRRIFECLYAAGLDISEHHSSQHSTVVARRIAEGVLTAYLWEDHPIHFFVARYVEACEAGEEPGTVIVLDILDREEMKAYKTWVRRFWR